jgi:hypothetical protein
VVESSGLLNRRRVKSSTGGSNPPLSASLFFNNLQYIDRFRGAIWYDEHGAQSVSPPPARMQSRPCPPASFQRI